MKARHVTREKMEEALKKVNERYDGNVIWNRFDQKASGFDFTLRVKSSKEAGHGLGPYRPWVKGRSQRRTVSACWHVHGFFFEELLKINPDATIRAAGRKIDRSGGNWQDWDAGSIMYPQLASEKCECFC